MGDEPVEHGGDPSRRASRSCRRGRSTCSRRRPSGADAHLHDAGAARRPGRPLPAGHLPHLGRQERRRPRPHRLDLLRRHGRTGRERAVPGGRLDQAVRRLAGRHERRHESAAGPCRRRATTCGSTGATSTSRPRRARRRRPPSRRCRCRRKAWLSRGALAAAAIPAQPVPVSGDAPVMAVSMNLGRVEKETVSRWLMVAYDDLYSIQYFGRNLRPYWRRGGMSALDLLAASAREYDSLRVRCAAFDEELKKDLVQSGGEQYAAMCCARVPPDRWPATSWWRTRTDSRCSSRRRTPATAASARWTSSTRCRPQFLLFSPTLVKAMLVPVLDYAVLAAMAVPVRAARPRHLPEGERPGVRRRREDRGEPDDGRGDAPTCSSSSPRSRRSRAGPSFVTRYWPVLTKWAEYLEIEGVRPGEPAVHGRFRRPPRPQREPVCEGHRRPRRVRTPVPVPPARDGRRPDGARRRGDRPPGGGVPRPSRKSLALRWVREADDGDHFKLAFDKPGTWSQKYNLVWDRLLDLDLFPAEVAKKEMAFYRRSLHRFGLPLDNRRPTRRSTGASGPRR